MMKIEFNKKLFNELIDVYYDQLKGGRADNHVPHDYDEEQLYNGIVIEFEHTKDPMIAMEIAMDHLAESPNYYIELEKMEDNLFEATLSFRHQTIMGILSMVRSMTEMHKKAIQKYIGELSKLNLDRFDDATLMRVKEIAKEYRKIEAKNPEKRYSQRDIDTAYKSEQEEHDKNNKQLASDMDIWKKLGYISDDD